MRLDAPTSSLLLSLLFSLSSIPGPVLARRPKDAILLSEVQSLTFRAGQMTTSRRVPPIPQLKCVSPRALCDLATPTLRTMRCVNQGSSYTSQDIEWACTATLPSTVQLSQTEVICEGYAHADDAYVLRGSCGVEYTVTLTEEGARRFPHLVGVGGGKDREEDYEVGWPGYLFGALFVAVLAWIIWGACLRDRRRGPRFPQGGGGRRGNSGGGGGGGWGGGRWDDPPPPYPGPKPSSSSAEGAGGWGPGFWSGLAGGAAAGYLAGSRGQRGTSSNYNNDYYGRPSRPWGSGSGWASGRSSSSSSSSSGRLHETTGYGSTSRR